MIITEYVRVLPRGPLSLGLTKLVQTTEQIKIVSLVTVANQGKHIKAILFNPKGA